jgi:C-terminal processing protease CtpA/Prc
MVNMDMIGRMKDSTLVVEGIGTSPSWREMMERLNQDYGFTMTLKKDGFGPSDHASFYGKDIPVLFFFTNLHDDYHRVSDDANKINAAGEAAVIKMVADAVTEIAGAEAAPQFTQAAPDSMQMGRGFSVTVGTIPDYAAEVDGMKISGVRPGSPAEKAGLQGGDIIVKFGSFDIKNVYDYTYALGSFSPGDEVEIVAMRAGQKVTVKVKLEARR